MERNRSVVAARQAIRAFAVLHYKTCLPPIRPFFEDVGEELAEKAKATVLVSSMITDHFFEANKMGGLEFADLSECDLGETSGR